MSQKYWMLKKNNRPEAEEMAESQNVEYKESWRTEYLK